MCPFLKLFFAVGKGALISVLAPLVVLPELADFGLLLQFVVRLLVFLEHLRFLDLDEGGDVGEGGQLGVI